MYCVYAFFMPDNSIYQLPTQLPEKSIGYIGALWASQQRRYREMWELYDGQRWDEIDQEATGDRNSKPIKRYRLQINDVAFACLTHAYTLFGEVTNDSDPLVRPIVEQKIKSKAMDVEGAQEFLDVVWKDSEPRKNQFLAGLISQVCGGVFWRVRYNLFERLSDPFALYPFKFEPMYPDYCFPVWATGTQNMTEMYVRYSINKDAAKATWGVYSIDWPDTVEYEEHWTQDYTVNGTTIPGKLEIKVGVHDNWRSIKNENNPFGIVPFVYIPHVPSNTFYGIPLPESIPAVAEEYNARLANIGDLVKQSALRIGKLRGVSGDKLKLNTLWKNGPPIVNLGIGNPDGIPPELEFDDPPAITPALIDYTRELERKERDSMWIPPIATGQDEGSQRSGQTLTIRMWPLQSHITTERWQWSSALNKLNLMALHMARIKGIGNLGNADPRLLHVSSDWAPMLPKDREQLVNEMALRDQAGHVLPEDALLAYGDTRETEIEEKVAALREYIEWKTELNKPKEPPLNQKSKSQDK